MEKDPIERYFSLIESEIKKQKFGAEPKSLYEPLRYIMKLGGKRLRPMLTMLAYGMYKPDPEPIVSQASAVETFHNFTLLHDDIMDNAPLRRGKVTVHKKWNTNTAILSGDVMQVKVYDMLLTVESSILKEVLVAFNHCATSVCEGQQWDMEFETSKVVSEQQYIDMIRLKTAVLLGFSLRFGAILAGASEQDKNALSEFGEAVGIGFQLKDDLLDVYADKEKFGKQVGGDIIANKKTFLLIKALKLAKGNNKKELSYWMSSEKKAASKKVKAVTRLFDTLGIRTITEQKIEEYFQLAFKKLEKVTVSQEAKKNLISYTLKLIARQN